MKYFALSLIMADTLCAWTPISVLNSFSAKSLLRHFLHVIIDIF